MRHISIFYFWKYFDSRFILYGTKALLYKLIKMTLLIFVLCHWTSSIYHFLAQVENELFGIEETWLHVHNIWDSPIYKRYTEGFYWAISTFLLVGSKGETFLETVYCIIMLVITIFLFSYILSTIGQILEDLSKRGRSYQKDLEILSYFAN